MVGYLTKACGIVLRGVAPLAVIVTLIRLIATRVSGGAMLSWTRIRFSFQRLNPIQGLFRCLGFLPNSVAASYPRDLIFELSRQGLKLCAWGVISSWLLLPLGAIAFRGGMFGVEGGAWFLFALRWGVVSTIALASAGVVVSALVAWRKWYYMLYQSEAQFRQELRENEGSPEIRQLRRQVHEQLLLNSGIAQVKRAKLIVVRKPI